MKTTTLKKYAVLAVAVLGFTACKKDDPAPAPTPVEAVNLSIEDLKKRSTGTISEENKVFRIKGFVISDKDGRNIDAKTVVLQGGNNKQGIVVNFAANHNFALGDEVQVGVSNQKLELVNGEIVLNAVPVDSASKTGTGSITARETSIAEIVSNKSEWNGTLVTIGGGMFNGNGKYSASLTYSVESGTIKTPVLTGASFEDTDYPVMTNGLTGVVRISGEEVLLNIRNTSDVKSPETFLYVEDFSGATSTVYSSLRTVATNQAVYNANISTTLTAAYPNFRGDYWTANQVSGSGTQIIKNLSAGSTDADASFLTPGRNYYSVLPYALTTTYARLTNPEDSWYNSGYSRFASTLSVFAGAGSTNTLENIKSITVVLAGSKMKTADFDPDGLITTNASEFSNFDAAKDGFVVCLYTNELEKIDESPVFRNQGEWQTVKFDGIHEKLSALTGNKRDLRISFGSTINQRGTAAIGRNGAFTAVFGSPIVIDKIIFEYTQKPFWAE
ncbi:DUF5689 domain-containing protein [Desertivirga xinjiangensis]|uniref:DUF5689 domain-containing protein n=1 Tax=Desertivirga xinjiangensis TaxID=539206 RepID=UPI00210E59FE|nr:DUF5689 domain-containing protein [Pedobacter xinjiangensis]